MMSRKDTIIIAVLINTGFLALLFMMATTTDIEGASPIKSIDHTVVEAERTSQRSERQRVPFTQVATRDELDQVLKNYSQPAPVEVVTVVEESYDKGEEIVLDEPYVEVTVKRGDALEKMARHNGTTVSAIMQANDLTSEKISIGQVLRVPVSSKKEIAPKDELQQLALAQAGAEYYTVKNGDNPWKIAKQFHVGFNQLLQLNQLDEGKARALRPGDVLRVK